MPWQSPDLGSRGQGYVVAQFVLLAAIAVVGWSTPDWPDQAGWLRLIGWALLAVGAALALAAVPRLGSALTPMPRPIPGAALTTDGVYRLVRHPIYGGVLLAALGWCLTNGPWTLPPWALLAGLFAVKARREEDWLAEAHPEYREFLAAVPRRFIPGLW